MGRVRTLRRCPLERVQEEFRAADAAVGELLTAAGQFFACCAPMPAQVFKEVYGSVVSNLGATLLARLLEAGKTAPSTEAAVCMSQLLTRLVLAVETRAPDGAGPREWQAFRLAAQLVGSPRADIVAARAQMHDLLSSEERQLLLAANPSTRGQEDLAENFREQRFESLFSLMAR